MQWVLICLGGSCQGARPLLLLHFSCNTFLPKEFKLWTTYATELNLKKKNKDHKCNYLDKIEHISPARYNATLIWTCFIKFHIIVNHLYQTFARRVCEALFWLATKCCVWSCGWNWKETTLTGRTRWPCRKTTIS